MSNIIIRGKNEKNRVGKPPAVMLIDPKYPRNVGAVVRACSCFDVHQVWWTGNRISDALEEKRRLPREERMKGYADVEMYNSDYPLDEFEDVTPVAIEVRENSEFLPNFVHPANPLYIFGPEDGSIPQVYLRHCHRFVIIPMRHCCNLAAAVYITLYDRQMKSGSFYMTPGKFEGRGLEQFDIEELG